MKIRTFKPAFFQSEKIAQLSCRQRLLFMAMWALADDIGNLEFKPREIAMQAFSWDIVNDQKSHNVGQPAPDSTTSGTGENMAEHGRTFPHVPEHSPLSVMGECMEGFDRMETLGLTVSYTIEGKPYLSIPSFGEHQKMSKPSRSRFPLPDGTPPGKYPSEAKEVMQSFFARKSLHVVTEAPTRTFPHVPA